MELKKFLSFEEFVDAKNILSQKIIKSGIQYDLLIANLRGGVFLCDAISRKLDIPYSVSSIALRDSKHFDRKNITLPRFEPDKRYLFIDDLIDSGKTIEVFNKHSNIDVAVIYKPKDYESRKNIFHYDELPKDTWIDFFWEIY